MGKTLTLRRQAGLSLLAGLMVLAVIGIVVTLVANYFM